MSDLVGKTLGQFRVEAVIGQGGMGVVYRAVDEQLRRTVALKVLPPDFAADPERRARFLREARSAAAVSHANIAAIHQVGEADGRLYLAMEHVTGRTLREVLAGGPLTVEQVIPVARGLLRGIARAHEKGVVHRDLKPDNVMIDDDGEAKILDFGIAKIAAAEAPASRGRSRSMALTRAGYVVGTPGYMSPEQGAARTVDARTDVFSFGVVLFEMLTGRLPFGGATPVDMLVRATTDPPDVASRHNPGVGPALDAVIRKCLEKAPEARWQTAREVLAALDAAVPSASGPQLPLPRAAAPSPASAHSSPDALAATVALAPPLGILDVPPPPTAVPAAAEAYRAGLQSLRDCDWTTAHAELSRAVSLDPQHAAALLRLAIVSGFNASYLLLGETRAIFTRAVRLRGRLSDRDQTLLRAVEPFVLSEPRDMPECRRRFEAACAAHPQDGEIHMYGSCLMYGFDPPAGKRWGERAVELDPQDASAWQSLGDALSDLGDADGARAAFERVTDVSPNGVDGYYELALLAALQGQAQAAERHARRVRSVLGPTPNECDIFAGALYAQGRPLDVVRGVLAAKLPVLPESRRVSTAAHDAAVVDVLSGDFGAAAARLDLWRAALAGETHMELHGAAARMAILVAREIGDDARALRVAEEFLAGSSGWTPTHRRADDATPLCIAERVRARRLGREQAAAEIEEWRGRAIGSPGAVWGIGYAPLLAVDPSSAGTARAAMPAADRFWFGRSPVLRFDAGLALLQVGEAARGLELLRAVAGSCLAVVDPFRTTLASLWLGRAREADRDTSGAAQAYAAVLSRWRGARPRSTSAEYAGARLAALR